MDTIKSKLTVLFEEPFWIGMVERECGGKYEVCKITFGPEPKDYQIYEFFQTNWKRTNQRRSKSLLSRTERGRKRAAVCHQTRKTKREAQGALMPSVHT